MSEESKLLQITQEWPNEVIAGWLWNSLASGQPFPVALYTHDNLSTALVDEVKRLPEDLKQKMLASIAEALTYHSVVRDDENKYRVLADIILIAGRTSAMSLAQATIQEIVDLYTPRKEEKGIDRIVGWGKVAILGVFGDSDDEDGEEDDE